MKTFVAAAAVVAALAASCGDDDPDEVETGSSASATSDASGSADDPADASADADATDAAVGPDTDETGADADDIEVRSVDTYRLASCRDPATFKELSDCGPEPTVLVGANGDDLRIQVDVSPITAAEPGAEPTVTLGLGLTGPAGAALSIDCAFEYNLGPSTSAECVGWTQSGDPTENPFDQRFVSEFDIDLLDVDVPSLIDLVDLATFGGETISGGTYEVGRIDIVFDYRVSVLYNLGDHSSLRGN